MNDRALLDDLIAKLREMLASRMRHLSILAQYVRVRLEGMAKSAGRPPTAGNETRPAS